MHEVKSEVAQSCLASSDPMDCNPPGSSVHGIFQARVLEWGAIAFSNPLRLTLHQGTLFAKLSVFLERADHCGVQRRAVHAVLPEGPLKRCPGFAEVCSRTLLFHLYEIYLVTTILYPSLVLK